MFDQFKLKVAYEIGIKSFAEVKDVLSLDCSEASTTPVHINELYSECDKEDIELLAYFLKTIDIDVVVMGNYTIKDLIAISKGNYLASYKLASMGYSVKIIECVKNSLPVLHNSEITSYQRGVLYLKSNVSKDNVVCTLISKAIIKAFCGIVLPAKVVSDVYDLLFKVDSLQAVSYLHECKETYRQLLSACEENGITFKHLIELNERTYFDWTCFIEEGVLVFPASTTDLLYVVFPGQKGVCIKLNKEQFNKLYITNLLKEIVFVVKEGFLVPCVGVEFVGNADNSPHTAVHYLFNRNIVLTAENSLDLNKIDNSVV